MAANNSFEENMKTLEYMKTLYNGMVAIPSKMCMKELENLMKKMEKLDCGEPKNLYEFSGRITRLQFAVSSCSPEAGMYLVNACLALSNIADIKEKVSEDSRTNCIKSFDVFGVGRYMESVNDKSAEKYVKTLVDSAIKELKKVKH